MQKCPRCHSSMIMGFGESRASNRSTWRCLACGAEVLDRGADRVEEAQRHAKRGDTP